MGQATEHLRTEQPSGEGVEGTDWELASASGLKRARRTRNVFRLAVTAVFAASAWFGYAEISPDAHLVNRCAGDDSGRTQSFLDADSQYRVQLCLAAFTELPNLEAGPDTEITLSRGEIAYFQRVYLAESPSFVLRQVDNSAEDGNPRFSDGIRDYDEETTGTWYEGDPCNVEGSVTFDSLTVDYFYRGRERTGTVDLGTAYVFEAPEGGCA